MLTPVSITGCQTYEASEPPPGYTTDRAMRRFFVLFFYWYHFIKSVGDIIVCYRGDDFCPENKHLHLH